MEVSPLFIQNILIQHKEFTEKDINLIQQYFVTFKYPIALIDDTAIVTLFKNSSIHTIDDIKQLQNYLLTEFKKIFTNIYTEQELNIFILYITILFETLYLDNQTVSIAIYQDILPYINFTSDKAEITFFLDELKFHYIRYLIIYDAPEKNQELINTTLNNLLLCEKQHNEFDYRVRTK